MTLTIVEEPRDRLAEYARVPIGFTVDAAFDREAVALLRNGARATPTPLATPYWKDYDTYRGNHPIDWAKSFDVSRWLVLAAYRDAVRVGGAIAVFDDPSIALLADCRDCALLWDIRVAAAVRRQHVGSALLRAVEDAARRRNCTTLVVETQQVNVAACRFYQNHGFVLERLTDGAYPDLPDEMQLLWHKSLRRQ